VNVFVADPKWGWEIVLYFFLGGIAAGAYFAATLVDLISRGESRPVARLGYLIALPLVLVCGLLLTIDLGKPERFWHMLFKSEVVEHALASGWPASGEGWRLMVHGFVLKPWSPMSLGSWGLSVFGACSALSLVGAVWPESRVGRWLTHGVLARTLQVVGCLSGFFLASYTGALLSATNQPLWSDTTWVAALFLASAGSTGLAAVLLLAWWRPVPAEAREHLERADVLMLALELVVFLAFLGSLGVWLRVVWATPHGQLLIVGTLALAVGLPLTMQVAWHYRDRLGIAASTWVAPAAAALALAGGFLLRYTIIHTPADVLALGPSVLAVDPNRPVGTPGPAPGVVTHWSPEDGRARETPGADPKNRPVTPRSKLFPAAGGDGPPPAEGAAEEKK
jgi:formate-dependent nitrite reductase membrane component NrfD